MADDIKIIIGVDATPVERAVRVMDNLEAEVRKVERAEKAGLITKERAKAETQRLTASMQKLKTVANGSISDFNKFEKGLYGSGKAARRNEVAFQQAGYQIQDFIVQVQAGTNPLIAFSQQGSQLAGFFAGPWGASIGVGIAALSSLGLAFMALSGEVKEFKDQLEETTGVLDEYFSLLKSNKSSFDDLFEKATNSIRLTSEASKDLLAIAKIEAFDGITKLNEALTESVLSASYLKTEMEDVGDLLGEGFAAKISAGLGGQAGEEIRSLYNSLVQLREAPTLEAQYEAAIKARDIFKENVDVTGQLTDQQKKFWKEISTTIEKMELLGVATETFQAAYDDVLGSEEGLAKAVEANNSLYDERLKKMQAIANTYVDIIGSEAGLSAAMGALEDMTSVGDSGYAGGRGGDPRKFTYMDEFRSQLDDTYKPRKNRDGTSDRESRLESLMNSLMTEQEQVEEWRATQLELLKEFNDKELELIGGKEAAAERIRNEYSARLIEAKQRESELVTNSSRGMYNELAGLLNMFAGKSKAAAIASIALTKGLRIAEIISSGAAAQVRALAELGPILGPPAAAKIGMFSKIQAGIVAATGLAQAASLGSGGGSGISSGGSVSGSAATVPASSEGTGRPTRVIIEGIDRNSLITGEQLANIFDQLYKENEDRGFVFEVAQ